MHHLHYFSKSIAQEKQEQRHSSKSLRPHYVFWWRCCLALPSRTELLDLPMLEVQGSGFSFNLSHISIVCGRIVSWNKYEYILFFPAAYPYVISSSHQQGHRHVGADISFHREIQTSQEKLQPLTHLTAAYYSLHRVFHSLHHKPESDHFYITKCWNFNAGFCRTTHATYLALKTLKEIVLIQVHNCSCFIFIYLFLVIW